MFYHKKRKKRERQSLKLFKLAVRTCHLTVTLNMFYGPNTLLP